VREVRVYIYLCVKNPPRLLVDPQISQQKFAVFLGEIAIGKEQEVRHRRRSMWTRTRTLYLFREDLRGWVTQGNVTVASHRDFSFRVSSQ
jgi:hypothetical protein